jgi:hypothetical protein
MMTCTAVCNAITDSCLDLFPYEVTLCFNFTCELFLHITSLKAVITYLIAFLVQGVPGLQAMLYQ